MTYPVKICQTIRIKDYSIYIDAVDWLHTERLIDSMLQVAREDATIFWNKLAITKANTTKILRAAVWKRGQLNLLFTFFFQIQLFSTTTIQSKLRQRLTTRLYNKLINKKSST